MMLLPLIVIGVVLYYFVENKRSFLSGSSKPLDQLQERYINGEIDEETYSKMKKVLEK